MILLPAWCATCKDLNLSDRVIPRDVSTRWNSTFAMLDVAIQFKAAIQAITGDILLGLDDYELSASEWQIAEQLCDVLWVSLTYPILVTNLTSLRSSNMQQNFSRKRRQTLPL
jgi:hypothetical protein